MKSIVEACMGTSWFKAHLTAVGTEVTLYHGAFRTVARDAKGTGEEAVMTADALILIDQNCPILRTLGDGTGGTDLHTGRVTTVHTAKGDVGYYRIGETPGLQRVNLPQPGPHAKLVTILTSYLAGFTTYTIFSIY